MKPLELIGKICRACYADHNIEIDILRRDEEGCVVSRQTTAKFKIINGKIKIEEPDLEERSAF